MAGALHCRPSDILTDTATITVTAGTEHASYLKANLSDRKAHTLAKSTGTTITYRATFGAAKTMQAVAFINTNATAIQLTNGAGLNQAVSIPTTPADGLRLDPWIDLRLLSLTSSTTWDIALTGPTNVALGEWLLVQTLRDIPLLWNLAEDEEHRSNQVITDYGVRLKYGMGVRQRRKAGLVRHETSRADMLALQRDARGALKEFLLLVNPNENDALYVDLATDLRTVLRRHPNISDIELQFIEAQKGLL